MKDRIRESSLEKFQTFGDFLRYLRRRAGMTQFELATMVGYSDAQISRLEQNLRQPDIPTLQARFFPALDLEDDPRAAERLEELAVKVRYEDGPALGVCPYKGMAYYNERDAGFFFGREALVDELMQRLLALAAVENTEQPGFLAIIGASGCGKSSLLRAGIAPAFRKLQREENWRIHILTPTAQPLDSLALTLTKDSKSSAAAAALANDLFLEKRALCMALKRSGNPIAPLHNLILVDQFEEVFTLCRSPQEREAFVDNLMAACSHQGPALVVIALRADFYKYCAGYRSLRQAISQQQVYIGSMGEEELRRAIEEPARRNQWQFEPGLVDLLLHDAGSEPGAMPLLSHALLETWEKRRGRTLTFSGYAASAGVRGAIAETAEAVFCDKLSHAQREIARRIFLRLTGLSVDADGGDTRRRAAISELIIDPAQSDSTRAVLNALAEARLITIDQDTVEVAHEALIREWPTLRQWIEEDRKDLLLRQCLTEAAQAWQAASQDSDLLYRGLRLAQARVWALSHENEINLLECDFLAASIDTNDCEIFERNDLRQRELDALQKLAEQEERCAEDKLRAARLLKKQAVYLLLALILVVCTSILALHLASQVSPL